jgi:hypothetical protein
MHLVQEAKENLRQIALQQVLLQQLQPEKVHIVQTRGQATVLRQWLLPAVLQGQLASNELLYKKAEEG